MDIGGLPSLLEEYVSGRLDVMRTLVRATLALALVSVAAAAPRHTFRFGPSMSVELFVGPSEMTSQKIEVRALYVDSKLREFTTGEPHDVNDRLFVIRKAHRVEDPVPEDRKKVPKWRWQRGEWLLVDRTSGRTSTLKLPEFDSYYSAASWHRDFVAYCGVSDDGEKLYAVVTQIGSKKLLVRKEIGAAHQKEVPESQCAPPKWQQDGKQVTFEPAGSAPLSLPVNDSSTAQTDSKREDHP